ncbi:MAG: MOSC N-terminal beta barrel domain-containing protein [Microthrixaceae bacterium]
MQVVELWRYPIKSLGGEPVEVSDVTELGLAGDRSWGIEDVATGKVLTARREPALLLAAGRLAGDGTAEVHLDGQVLRTDDELTAWLGRPVRLRAADAHSGGTFEAPLDDLDEQRSGWATWTGPAGAFHDSKRTRVSLIGRGTLAGEDPRRFRANVILDVDAHSNGAPTGSVEDGWVGHSLSIGTVTLDVRKHIGRCVMVTRPQPGLERDLEVLKRINRDRRGLAAVGALVTTPGRISIGDTIRPERPQGLAPIVRPATSRAVSQAARQLPRLDRLRRRIPRRT